MPFIATNEGIGYPSFPRKRESSKIKYLSAHSLAGRGYLRLDEPVAIEWSEKT